MLDLRPPLTPFFDTFAIPAVVTPLNGDPVNASAIWIGSLLMIARTMGGLPAPMDLRPRIALRRDEVPDLPLGSQILAPRLLGGTPETWIVDKIEDPTDAETHTAIVHEYVPL